MNASQTPFEILSAGEADVSQLLKSPTTDTFFAFGAQTLHLLSFS